MNDFTSDHLTIEEVECISVEEMRKIMLERQDEIIRKLLIESSSSIKVLDEELKHQGKSKDLVKIYRIFW